MVPVKCEAALQPATKMGEMLDPATVRLGDVVWAWREDVEDQPAAG